MTTPVSSAPDAGTLYSPTLKPAPRFDSADLYGSAGLPQAHDIDQDDIGDCYFVATLAALAEQQPDRIQNAIEFDPGTGTFTVALHVPTLHGIQQWKIPVTQQEIEDNLVREGGSTVDGRSGVDGPIWPAVMETAYAKLNDGQWSNGLAQGYDAIDGGYADEAMFTLTGDSGDKLTWMPMDVPAQSEILRREVDQALAAGRPVTLSTDPASRSLWDAVRGNPGKPDGLVDNHVYTVERIYRDHTGEVMVELRNPWAHNAVGEGKDTPSPTIKVDLKTLIETQSLGYFNVGPRR